MFLDIVRRDHGRTESPVVVGESRSCRGGPDRLAGVYRGVRGRWTVHRTLVLSVWYTDVGKNPRDPKVRSVRDRPDHRHTSERTIAELRPGRGGREITTDRLTPDGRVITKEEVSRSPFHKPDRQTDGGEGPTTPETCRVSDTPLPRSKLCRTCVSHIMAPLRSYTVDVLMEPDLPSHGPKISPNYRGILFSL